MKISPQEFERQFEWCRMAGRKLTGKEVYGGITFKIQEGLFIEFTMMAHFGLKVTLWVTGHPMRMMSNTPGMEAMTLEERLADWSRDFTSIASAFPELFPFRIRTRLTALFHTLPDGSLLPAP